MNKNILLMITALFISGCASTIDLSTFKQHSRCEGKAKPEKAMSSRDVYLGIIKREPPKYPIKALEARLSGYVKLEYDISKAGQPTNITVIESKPGKVFNAEATKALLQWRFKPSSQPRECLKTQLDFAVN